MQFSYSFFGAILMSRRMYAYALSLSLASTRRRSAGALSMEEEEEEERTMTVATAAIASLLLCPNDPICAQIVALIKKSDDQGEKGEGQLGRELPLGG